MSNFIPIVYIMCVYIYIYAYYVASVMSHSLQPYGLGILQARILEWVAMPSPGDLPDPGIKPLSPALAGEFFTTEPPGKPSNIETEMRINFNTLIPFFLCSYL